MFRLGLVLVSVACSYTYVTHHFVGDVAFAREMSRSGRVPYHLGRKFPDCEHYAYVGSNQDRQWYDENEHEHGNVVADDRERAFVPLHRARGLGHLKRIV